MSLKLRCSRIARTFTSSITFTSTDSVIFCFMAVTTIRLYVEMSSVVTKNIFTGVDACVEKPIVAGSRTSQGVRTPTHPSGPLGRGCMGPKLQSCADNFLENPVLRVADKPGK